MKKVKVDMANFLKWRESMSIPKNIHINPNQPYWTKCGGTKYGLQLHKQHLTNVVTEIPSRFILKDE